MSSSASTMESDSFVYKSASYPSTVISSMYQLWKCYHFCDVTIKVDGICFRVHRSMLAASSPYFQAMFLSGMAEEQSTVVHIHDVSATAFEKILDFIYSGMIIVTADNCQELMMAADMVGIGDIVNACCQFMEMNLTTENCTGIYMFADSFHCDNLKKSVETYINDNFLMVSQQEEFLSLPKETLVQFLKSENLHVETEKQVFDVAMKWLLHDVSVRRKHVFDIMVPVRLAIVSERHLKTSINDCSDLSLKIALQKLLQNFKCDRKICLELKLSMLKSYLMQPRRGARKNVFVVGGYTRLHGGRWSDSRTLSVVEQFDTFHQQWTVLSRLNHARSGLGVAICKGQLFVAGGESDSLIFDSVECYDMENNKWNALPHMLSPRCGFGLVTMNECLFAIGGCVGTEIANDIEMFDTRSFSWTVYTKMITFRQNMGVIQSDGLVYLIGGMSDLGELRTVESFNPVTKEWQKLRDMQCRRAYVGVGAIDGCIYATGGWNEQHGSLKSVEKYDPLLDIWEQIEPMKTARAGSSVVSVNGLLYVIGGRMFSDEFSAPVSLKTVECFDPSSEVWFEVAEMPTSRCEAGAVVL